MLAQAARLTEEHGIRYAGTVPLVKADSRPHGGPGGKSDYAQHVHLVSAPPSVDDKLNRKLVALLDQYRKGLKPPRGQVAGPG